eukprot:766399-Hanusia_phi.AAC.4
MPHVPHPPILGWSRGSHHYHPCRGSRSDFRMAGEKNNQSVMTANAGAGPPGAVHSRVTGGLGRVHSEGPPAGLAGSSECGPPGD